MKKNNKTIGIITLGCAKNLVDTELMAGLLVKKGYSISLDTTNCDVVLINTCAFIHDAQKESIRAILEEANDGKKVIVAGCLAQRFKEELKKEIPEISAIVGSCDFDKIVEAIENDDFYSVSDAPEYNYIEDVEREQITVGSASYIKIADGCNYACGYCVIPKLKGKYKSRKIEDIVKEAKKLANKGVGEIILIAQDTTNYGIDLYGKPQLANLLRELNKIEDINWIRVLYAYPTNFNDDLIDAYKTCDKVVKYIDIPLQHSNIEVLKNMKRPPQDYDSLIKKIRKNIKNVCIRTTFIVGYPMETEEQFEDLYNFVKRSKFDRLGVFEFSKEEGTYAYNLKPQVSARIKKDRKNRILKLQSEISYEINSKLVGKKIPCIIEEIRDDGIVVARSYKDAPEVDGLVYIKTDKHLTPCDIELVKITDFDNYDLFGII
ncbi:MAG: 30S ribosomal protein S12 methylthiotransferase RimO [Cyanobacteria bacterium SIG30]|nr:30S ribosomal protein S12 methylthiotransferase RimO [Cyanobacteria bacterium SIG30]